MLLVVFLYIISWSIVSIVDAYALTKVDEQILAVYAFGISAIIMTGYAILKIKNLKFKLKQASTIPWVYLSRILTALGYVFYFDLLNTYSVYKITILSPIYIVFSIILAHFILKEKMNKIQIIGIILILFGTFIIYSKEIISSMKIIIK